MANLKNEILQYATDHMQEVGIRSLSVDDICAAIGCSKKTFYVYFPSKDDFIEAILITGEQQIEEKVQDLVNNRSVTQCIVDWNNIARASHDTKQTPPFLYDLQKYYPNIHKNHQKRLQSIMQALMAQFLDKGKSEGIFRMEIDTAITAMLFVNVHMGIMAYTQLGELRMSEAHAYSRQSMDILLRGIFTPEGFNILEKEVNNKKVQ